VLTASEPVAYRLVLSYFLSEMSPQDGHAKNYKTASRFVKVIPRKLLASFFLDTVYKQEAQLPQRDSASARLHVFLASLADRTLH